MCMSELHKDISIRYLKFLLVTVAKILNVKAIEETKSQTYKNHR